MTTSTESELTHKKNMAVQRGVGIEQLERHLMQENWKKMTQIPFPNAAVHFRHSPAPPIIYAGAINHCQFRYFAGTDTVVEVMDVAKNRCTYSSEQAKLELMSILRNRGGSLTEHDYKKLMSMGPTAESCHTSDAGPVGLHSGKESSVRAGTGGEKGSVSSLDVFYCGRGVRAFSIILTLGCNLRTLWVCSLETL
ncbi:hypothetical protein M8C21_025618 [Ambrosia artemisiifolia]|uniref:Uncharacterized protein n=1 Tax=Ambrosia artemisiifolia TaxID=4212 RepID=A0AAD5D6E5_AMBAR|nr:hypothetical protein M8C21_025618 [Ambrosia artemisiifolia]